MNSSIPARAHFSRTTDFEESRVQCEHIMWWFKQQNGSRKSALEPLGSLESELMERIWLLPETSVRDLHCEFSSRLAYTTVMTTLDRLYKKGLLARRRVGKAYVYAAKLTEKEYRARAAQHLINLAWHDGKHRNAVLSCFVDVVSEADGQMLQELDHLIKAKRRAQRRQEAQ
jgi:predicted transcriptional regulator